MLLTTKPHSGCLKLKRCRIIKLYLLLITGIHEWQAEHDAWLLEPVLSAETVERIGDFVGLQGVLEEGRVERSSLGASCFLHPRA